LIRGEENAMDEYYCLWCGAYTVSDDIHDAPAPPVDDDEAWDEIAYDHYPNCLWLTTRDWQDPDMNDSPDLDEHTREL